MSKWDERRPTSLFGSPEPSAPPAHPSEVAPSPPDYVVRDILVYVEQALGRFGTPGKVRFHDSQLFLDAAGPDDSPRISINAWSGDWQRMDESTRRRRAEDAARALSHKRLVSASTKPSRRMVFVDPKLMIATGILVLCALWIAFGDDRLPGSHDAGGRESAAAPPVSQTNPSRAEQSGQPARSSPSGGVNSGEARASRVCAATLTRIFQGGSVSVADVDGFRVEIALLRAKGKEPLDSHPALTDFVQQPSAATGSKFIWEKENALASVETSDSVVVIRRMVVGDGDDLLHGVTLSFGGTLVDPYFKEEERGRFFHIAAALTDALGATHAAVYARCFDRPLHALGSWFHGHDTGAAISSLVYFMGTYARPLHLAKPYAQLPGEQELNRLHAFESIQSKTAPLTREDLATLLGNEGGMATGRDGEPVIITFPFGDGNRASRASRAVVRVAGLGR